MPYPSDINDSWDHFYDDEEEFMDEDDYEQLDIYDIFDDEEDSVPDWD